MKSVKHFKSMLELVSRLQSGCSEWREHRSGCVTASNMKRVFTRVASLLLKDNKDPSALVRTVMGYTDSQLSNYALKHGVSMEPHAKNMFVHLMKRSHKGFSARDCGGKCRISLNSTLSTATLDMV